MKPFDFGRWKYTTSAFQNMQLNLRICNPLLMGGKSAFFLRESMAVPKSEGIRFFFCIANTALQDSGKNFGKKCK